MANTLVVPVLKIYENGKLVSYKHIIDQSKDVTVTYRGIHGLDSDLLKHFHSLFDPEVPELNDVIFKIVGQGMMNTCVDVTLPFYFLPKQWGSTRVELERILLEIN